MPRSYSGRLMMTEDLRQNTGKTRRRLRKVLKGAVIAAAVLVVAGVVASYAIDYAFVLVPPEVQVPGDIVSREVVSEGDVTRTGDCWLARRDGLLRMRLEGGPLELGYAHARLTNSYIQRQESEFLALIRQFVTSDWKLWLIKKFVVVRNRGIDKYIKREQLVEIYGLSLGYDDPFPEIGPLYHRLVNYHAAHDIGHALMDSPLVGCTSLAARGSYSANEHLWVGRNFDFDAVRCFDENKIVMLVEPDDGLKFIAVGWPGLVGVVTGMNEERVFAAMNAAHSTDRERIGTPVSLVMREVMQYAHSLEEAVDIISKAAVFVTDSYLVADGETGQVVIVEKTPLRCAVVAMEGESIVSANHFLSSGLAGDAANVKYMKEGTSPRRHERMRELVDQHRGRIDAAVLAGILRDRKVDGVNEAGLGNEAAINGFVATHSVIADVTAGILWVSAGPHQLGAYVPFSLDDFEMAGGAAGVEADELLRDGRFEAYLESKGNITFAREALEKGEIVKAKSLALAAAEGNPGHFEAKALLGEIAFARKDWAASATHFEEALSAWVPFASERERIASLVEECRSNIESPQETGR